jgi:hypothetical protein
MHSLSGQSLTPDSELVKHMYHMVISGFSIYIIVQIQTFPQYQASWWNVHIFVRLDTRMDIAVIIYT